MYDEMKEFVVELAQGVVPENINTPSRLTEGKGFS